MDPTAAAADLSGGPVLLSLSLGTAFFALATSFVRFSIRAGISKHIGADDYTSGVAAVVALVGTVFAIIEATATDPTRAMEFAVLGKPWYLMSDTLSKISICLLFMLLLRGTRQWRILLSVLIFFMAAVNFSFALTVNLQCRPLEKLWDPSVDGVCWDPNVQRNFGYFQGAFSVFTWFFLSLFCILMVGHVTREGAPQWPYYASTALSFACGIFSIVRTAKTAQMQQHLSSAYTSNTLCASLMSNLEQNFGLVAANILTLGPLFSARAAKLSVLSSSRHRFGKKSKTQSRAGSTRPITRTDSRAGSITDSHSHSAVSINSSEIDDLKRSTPHLIIQVPQAQAQGRSNGGGLSFLRSANSSLPPDDDEEYDLGEMLSDIDIEASWPRGIIKTVSVEVVEEVNPDHVPPPPPPPPNASAAASTTTTTKKIVVVGPPPPHSSREDDGNGNNNRNSGASVGMEQDWEAMLRAGPPTR
ncbi:hypothetical protein QBC37DRAFT_344874 [Rhypophila decipiens]|uniref:Rhodopsin domain-containing protein n=1 Tax=Rhypophila decipiens TaxID=261697 RepID=A0AAN6YAF8_9PEZI|nr:hypothetical protein QBC37DRAFT_344874 [Rhypophila decipiens]